LNDPSYFATGYHELKITNPNAQTAQAVEQVLPDSCVLDLKFDEDSGATAHDSSSYGNNGILASMGGTLYGSTQWVPGRFDGYGLQFDGASGYVKISSIPGFWTTNPGNGPTSVSLWFKTSVINPSAQGNLFSDSWEEIGFLLLSSGKLRAEVYQRVDSLQTITANDWHFAALSYDNNIMTFYLDGQLQGSTLVTIGNGFYDTPFGIGADPGYGTPENFFNGIVDDVRIWNRSLSQADIQAEMQSSSPVISPIWSFEPNGMWVDGKFGKALSFDGVNDYVSVPNSANLNISKMTVIAWVKLNNDTCQQGSNGGPGIVGNGVWGYPGTRSWELRFNNCGSDNGRVYFMVSTDGTENPIATSGSNFVTLNQWYQVAGVFNGTNALVFINGILSGVSSQTSGTSIFNSNRPVLIGMAAQGSYLNGTIDEVRIFNQALTPDQIDHVVLKMK
jgi:hypothetical protein